jgi:hypothetical protein
MLPTQWSDKGLGILTRGAYREIPTWVLCPLGDNVVLVRRAVLLLCREQLYPRARAARKGGWETGRH